MNFERKPSIERKEDFQRWEYKIIPFSLRSEFVQQLNRLGEQRWELVSVAVTGNIIDTGLVSGTITSDLILRRPLS